MEQISLSSDKFFSILNTILSTLNIDEILTTVVEDIRSILGADKCTLYLIDRENNELYSIILQANNIQEIRLSITKNSLAGCSAITGKILNIKDVYNEEELKSFDTELCFDKRWDEKSGYRTKSILVVPVSAKGYIIGVLQALNKPDGFSDFDINTMGQIADLLGIAVNNAILYKAIEEEKKLTEYIIDDIEEGVCILDTKKRIISANKFLEVMGGMRYSVQEMIGKYLFEIFPNFTNTLEEKIKEVLLYGFKKIALSEILEIKIIPHLDDKGRVKRLILIFTRV